MGAVLGAIVQLHAGLRRPLMFLYVRPAYFFLLSPLRLLKSQRIVPLVPSEHSLPYPALRLKCIDGALALKRHQF